MQLSARVWMQQRMLRGGEDGRKEEPSNGASMCAWLASSDQKPHPSRPSSALVGAGTAALSLSATEGTSFRGGFQAPELLPGARIIHEQGS